MRTRNPKIVDMRGTLPVHETRRFARRRLSDIRGIVIHQTLGDYNVTGIAKYHVSEECHISPGEGCPAICYTYFIEKDGTVIQCNDLEAVTWSQGGKVGPPLPMTRSNYNYVAVVLRGDFSGKGHKGKAEPTEEQLEAVRRLWAYLQSELDLPEDMLFGHDDFGKKACPGTATRKVIDEICKAGLKVKLHLPKTVENWQRGLVRLGHDLGEYGSKQDGVDGDWGDASQEALVAFQAKHSITGGKRDAPTAVMFATELAKLPPEKKKGGK